MNELISLSTAPWFHTIAPYLPFLLLWSIIWKGLALWHSARRGQPWWFCIMTVVNTVGILEIVYLLVILKLKLSELFSTKVS